jgi:hypothetical protein
VAAPLCPCPPLPPQNQNRSQAVVGDLDLDVSGAQRARLVGPGLEGAARLLDGHTLEGREAGAARHAAAAAGGAGRGGGAGACGRRGAGVRGGAGGAATLAGASGGAAARRRGAGGGGRRGRGGARPRHGQRPSAAPRGRGRGRGAAGPRPRPRRGRARWRQALAAARRAAGAAAPPIGRPRAPRSSRRLRIAPSGASRPYQGLPGLAAAWRSSRARAPRRATRWVGARPASWRAKRGARVSVCGRARAARVRKRRRGMRPA